MTTIFFWGPSKQPPTPQSPCHFLSVCLCTFIPISVCLCPCLCACTYVFVSLWYILSARPKHSTPPPPAHPCLCVSDGAGKRWGGSCSSYLQTPLSIFSTFEGCRNYSLCLSPSSTFQELLWSDYKLRIMKLLCWFLMLSINIRSLGAGPTVQYPIKLVAVEGPCVFGRPPILRSTSLEE